ncbi:hypothetical protein NEMBOFW57_004588 [Staphylotrichum longicolle]|uniref:Uncharacterized protein n=1 Tax=Staphylotrichum longicolle TaxID=669026 RepID=A0AAD4I6T2_9PEZI|nr:hypothetical protein NEMBOFW57_004588 [Staphylotrichum longicolle]
MADVSIADSTPESRRSREEEEWPDIDVDSDTSEGAEAIRRADAAFEASIERSLQRQREQEPGSGSIPKELYVKARDHQDQLTQEERQLLLTRGDVAGKALACPDSLTTDEIHDLLFWPPPDVLRANVQQATGGALSTAGELFAKAKHALGRGQFDTEVNDEECQLLERAFHPKDDPTYLMGRMMGLLGSPGYGAAWTLMSNRVGMDGAVMQAASTRFNPILRALRDEPPPVRQQKAELMHSMESNRQQFLSGNVTEEEFLTRDRELTGSFRSLTAHLYPPAPPPRWPGAVQWPGPPRPIPRPSSDDEFGYGPWPKTFDRRGAFTIFRDETDLRGLDVQPGWHFLPEEQKKSYRVRAEASRRAAWAEFESTLANTPPSTRMENYLWFGTLTKKGIERRLTLKEIITGFEMFRDEQPEGTGLAYQEVVARWEALTKKQREAYDERAWAIHREAYAALPPDYLKTLCRERGDPGPWES